MSLILLITGMIAITLLGYLVIKLINFQMSLIEGLGLGYLIGIGIYTYSLFLLNLLGIPYSLIASNVALLSLLGMIITITYFLGKRSLFYQMLNTKFTFPHFTLAEWIMIILIVAPLLSSLITNLYWPVKDWDSLVLYDFRAI